jgi:phosphate acetyltransferase
MPSERQSMTHYPHLDRIIAEALKGAPARVAVVYPCTASALEAAVSARRLGLAEPTLVGPADVIARVAKESGQVITGIEIVDSGDDPVDAARAAVALRQAGRADLIMKGSLNTDELLGVIVARESGMRTARRISHAFVFDIPDFPRPLLMTDCVVNIAPDLMAKRDIIQNSVDLAIALGIALPHVAVLSAVETINPAIPGTLEAAALAKMAERGQIERCIVDGPLAYDVAISAEAARIKKLSSPVAGKPDILLVPNLEAGNMLYKQLIYLAKAECAGIILGTAIPIVLTSRADSPLCRVASCALGALYARRKN